MANIIDFLLKSKEYNYNIYGDKIDNLQKFGNICKEYYKERYDKKSNQESFYFTSNDDIEKFNFEFNNKIYFLYIRDKKLFKEIKKKCNLENNKIIWFSEEPIDESIYKAKINEEPELKENNYIKNKQQNII